MELLQAMTRGDFDNMPTPVGEAFEAKRRVVGDVKFSVSTMADPHVQRLIQYTAQRANVPVAVVEQAVQKEISELTDVSKKAPLLYETMIKNAAESAAFNIYWNACMPPPTNPADMLKRMLAGKTIPVRIQAPEPAGPTFREFIFMKLMQSIRADHDDFFPLRGFVDRRPLMNINWIFTPSATSTQYSNVDTAAATPTGSFIFNKTFMQCLLDYAHLKQIKPAGAKYVSNGGDIPDEYAYVEFLIIHELMHYSNDDFYYQRIIPNADSQIINWVGDFRTNYLLVKSGYEQLPIGLYNDHINYDRQKEYVEMYNKVKEEFDKLPKSDQGDVSQAMNSQADDHDPGQREGKEAEINTQPTTDEIDENAKRIRDDMEKGKDSKDRAKESGQSQLPSDGPSSEPGGKGANGSQEIDYSKIQPTFNWRTLVKRFVATAKPRPLETYAKPHRRSATGASMMQQTGSSAVKPGEKMADHSDVNLAFVIDSSGSMSTAIASVYANISSLLKQPVFSKSDFLIMRFSGDYDIHKGNFAKNKAAKVQNVAEKPKVYNTTVQSVFTTHFGAGTDFSGECVNQISAALSLGYNVMIFSDDDILYSSNIKGLMALIKQAPQKVFVIFDNRDTYIRARQTPGMVTTPNITHL